MVNKTYTNGELESLQRGAIDLVNEDRNELSIASGARVTRKTERIFAV